MFIAGFSVYTGNTEALGSSENVYTSLNQASGEYSVLIALLIYRYL
jgi:hypothetical protein